MIGIAAKSKNNVIGNSGKIPWSCPEDLKFFKTVTTNKNIIVGSETFRTLPFLPNRNIYIMTRRNIEEVKIDHTLYPKVIPYFMKNRTAQFVNGVLDVPEEAVLCGGGKIYKQFMEYCEYFYLTTIDQEVEGDTLFPIEKFLKTFTRKETVRVGDGYIIEKYKK